MMTSAPIPVFVQEVVDTGCNFVAVTGGTGFCDGCLRNHCGFDV